MRQPDPRGRRRRFAETKVQDLDPPIVHKDLDIQGWRLLAQEGNAVDEKIEVGVVPAHLPGYRCRRSDRPAPGWLGRPPAGYEGLIGCRSRDERPLAGRRAGEVEKFADPRQPFPEKRNPVTNTAQAEPADVDAELALVSRRTEPCRRARLTDGERHVQDVTTGLSPSQADPRRQRRWFPQTEAQ